MSYGHPQDRASFSVGALQKFFRKIKDFLLTLTEVVLSYAHNKTYLKRRRTEMKKMTAEEIKSAIEFGKDAVAEYKKRNEEIPGFIYDRIIELQDALIEMLSK